MHNTYRTAMALAICLALSLLPSSVSALGIDIVGTSSTGQSTTILAPGDILTVDLVVNNDSELPVLGLGLAAAGYDVDWNGIADDGLEYLDGIGAESVLNGTLIQDPNDPYGLTPLGGLNNLRVLPRELIGGSRYRGSGQIVPHGLGVEFMAGISLTATDGDGRRDIGIGGNLVGEGDVHFRLRFRATPQIAPTQMTLVFGIPLDPWGQSGWGQAVVGPGGVLYDFDNDFLEVFNQSLVVTIVPEPGTALLLGFGLALLARRRD